MRDSLPFLRTLVAGALSAIAAIAPLAVALPSRAQVSRNYQFRDAADYWASTCIEGAGEDELMKGYLDGSFRPDGTMTRAEFAAVMVKAFPNAPDVRAAPNFTDVASGFWGEGAIATAYQKGYLSGYPDQLFKPNQAISRAQAIIVIASAQARLATVGDEPDTVENSRSILEQYFKDASEIPAYAERSIAQATRRRLVVNYPAVDRLRPNDSITRGEATALLCRANAAGTDARYYVPAQYVAAFGFSAKTGENNSEWADPLLLAAFPQQSALGLLLNYAALPANTPDRDYRDIKQLFFSANDGRNGEELWVTDGTANGTRLFLDVAPGLAADGKPESSAPQFVGFADERFWFATNQGSTPGDLNNSIWSSDGTVEGTQAIASVSPTLAQALSNASSLIANPTNLFKGRLPFAVETSNSYQIWLSDGTSAAGTQQLAEFLQPSRGTSVREFIATPSTMFFAAPAVEGQPPLWKSDGTPAGTSLLKAIDSTNGSFSVWKDRIFFRAETSTAGGEIWTSDGTSTGTRLLKDIYPGSDTSRPTLMAELGSSFLALASDAEGLGLWATDGTSENTRRIQLLREGDFFSSATLFKVDNNRMYFSISGIVTTGDTDNFSSTTINELWVTDGTALGTQRLHGSLSTGPFTAFKGRLFFQGGGPNGQELWVSDGTAEGTHQVLDLSPGTTTVPLQCPPPPPELDKPGYCQAETGPNHTFPAQLTVRGDFLYFLANRDELFRTDGTGLGMQQIKTLNSPRESYSHAIASIDAALLFTRYDENTNEWQLWALPD